MEHEQKHFYVTPEIIRLVVDKADSQETLTYIGQTMRMAEEKHPHLQEYFDSQAEMFPDHHITYRALASITYEAVSRQLDSNNWSIDIQPEDIAVQKQRETEVFAYRRQSELVDKGVLSQRTVNFSSYIQFENVLQARAPKLFEYIKEVSRELSTIDNQVAAIHGVFDGFMPFYAKSVQFMEYQKPYIPENKGGDHII